MGSYNATRSNGSDFVIGLSDAPLLSIGRRSTGPMLDDWRSGLLPLLSLDAQRDRSRRALGPFEAPSPGDGVARDTGPRKR